MIHKVHINHMFKFCNTFLPLLKRSLPGVLGLSVFLLSSCGTQKAAADTSGTSYITESTDSSGSDTMKLTNSFQFDTIPEEDGTSVFVANQNIPFFSEGDLERAKDGYKRTFKPDTYRRCRGAMLTVSRTSLQPESHAEEEDPSFSPTGFTSMTESGIPAVRCQLPAADLTGESAQKENVIAGTGQLSDVLNEYELSIRQYLENGSSSVLLRMTPDFRDSDMVCRGILLEARNTDESADPFTLCVYLYNIQDGWDLDYHTGYAKNSVEEQADSCSEDVPAQYQWVLDTSSKKVHFPSCPSVSEIPSGSKRYSNKSLADLSAEGYIAHSCLRED